MTRRSLLATVLLLGGALRPVLTVLLSGVRASGPVWEMRGVLP